MDASFPRHTNGLQARSGEQSLEELHIGQCGGLIKQVALVREVETEFVHQDSEKRYAVGGGPDADCEMAVRAKNAPPLLERSDRVDPSACTNAICGENGGFAGARRHVKNPVTQSDAGLAEQSWDVQPGPSP